MLESKTPRILIELGEVDSWVSSKILRLTSNHGDYGVRPNDIYPSPTAPACPQNLELDPRTCDRFLPKLLTADGSRGTTKLISKPTIKTRGRVSLWRF